MFAAAIRIDAERERDVRRVVSRNDALDLLGRDDGLRPPRLVFRWLIPAVVERFSRGVLEAAFRIEGCAPALMGGAMVYRDGLWRHTVIIYSLKTCEQRLVISERLNATKPFAQKSFPDLPSNIHRLPFTDYCSLSFTVPSSVVPPCRVRFAGWRTNSGS